MRFQKPMRRPSTQFVCLATLAVGALASFRGNEVSDEKALPTTVAPSDAVLAQEHQEEGGDGHGAAPLVPEEPHMRAPIGVSLTITTGSWLLASGPEWFAKQAELQDQDNKRFTFDPNLGDGDGGWVDAQDVFRFVYDEEEDIWAYWSWAGPNQLTRGRRDYLQFCSSCHGIDGDGYGRSAQWLRPSPRDFHQANFKFTKVTKALPSDAALMRLIKRGLDGTPMLPWALSDEQLTDIIQYVKSLSPEGEGWRNPFTEVGEVVESGKDPWVELDQVNFAVETGKKLYHGTANCASCHPGYVNPNELGALIGDETAVARPDYYLPVLKDSDYVVQGYGVKIMPPDFTFHQVRAGIETRDLFETIASGIKGTAMPQWKGALSDKQIWALAHYVESLISDYKGKTAERAGFMKTLRAGQ
jgi:mono/diheme cytochrome c family protein